MLSQIDPTFSSKRQCIPQNLKFGGTVKKISAAVPPTLLSAYDYSYLPYSLSCGTLVLRIA